MRAISDGRGVGWVLTDGRRRGLIVLSFGQRQREELAMAPFFTPAPMLQIGRVVRYDGRVWLVGLVNECRARLDPVSAGNTVVADPVSGRTFSTYGQSVNISPSSTLDDADIDALTLLEQSRLVRLVELAEADKDRRQRQQQQSQGDATMANVNVNGADTDAAAMPVPTQTKADRNKERLAKLREAKAAGKLPSPTAKASERKAAAEPKEMNSCVCGCGGETAKYFVPGHDARFKGWLLQIERGLATKESLIPAAVIAQYKWVKRGKGSIPTKLWTGEAHNGFTDPAKEAAREAKAEARAEANRERLAQLKAAKAPAAKAAKPGPVAMPVAATTKAARPVRKATGTTAQA